MARSRTCGVDTTKQSVCTITPQHCVVTTTGEYRVVARISIDEVSACFAQNRVVATTCKDRVVASAGLNRVVTRACRESLSCRCANNTVGAGTRLNDFHCRDVVAGTRDINGRCSQQGVTACTRDRDIAQVDAGACCGLCEIDGRTLVRNDPSLQIHVDVRQHLDVNTFERVAYPSVASAGDTLHLSPGPFQNQGALGCSSNGQFRIGAVSGGHLPLQQIHHLAVVDREAVGPITGQVNGLETAQLGTGKTRHIQMNAIAAELQGVEARTSVDQHKVQLGNRQNVISTATANDVCPTQAVDGVIARTTCQPVWIEITNQQIVARSSRLDQRIGEVAPIDDKTFTRVVAIALVDGHTGHNVHKAIAVEVARCSRESKLVLRQAACDDQTILA